MVLASNLVRIALVALPLPLVAQVAPTVPEQPTPVVDDGAPVDAPAAADEQRSTALLLLSGYHGIPTAQEFEDVLDDPRALLFEIARDPDVSSIQRDRAIAALAYWPGEDLRAFYTELLAAPDTPEMEKHRLIGHLATAFGDSSLDVIAPYLQATDVQFRLTAVDALGRIGTPAALQRLEAAAAVEVSPVVLEQIQRIER